MKAVHKLISENSVRNAAQFMKVVCYFMILFYVFCMILSFMGRQSFWLHTKNGIFETAIYAEENHTGYSPSMTLHLNDDIRVWTNESDQIDFTVRIGLSVIFVVHAFPLILGLGFLSCVLSNIRDGQIFTNKNAVYLFYYGLLQLFAAVLVPFIKLFVCRIITAVSSNQVSITTGKDIPGSLVQGIAFIIAAYIIYYGVNLQDEVDHTL